MKFLRTALQASGITYRSWQFWLAAALFWGVFWLLSYAQSRTVYLATGLGWTRTDVLDLSLRWGLWWACTPLILFAAYRAPFIFIGRPVLLLRNLTGHLAFQLLLSVAVAAAGKFLLFNILHLSTGHKWGPEPLWFTISSRFSVSLAVYMLLVVSYNVYAYAHRNQVLRHQNMSYELANEQLKSQLSNAQLQALKMQLNPHFLFNTHHAIVGLILQQQNERAIEMVTALSDLLRGILANGDAQLIPLREELQFIGQYLHIQHIRFQDRLRIDLDIAPEALDAEFPQFLLQPLVENAMIHGIEDLPGDAVIRLSARREGAELVVTVYDNGKGAQRPLGRPRPTTTGLGLRNTRARLEKLYQERAHLAFEQPASGGTLARVHLPWVAAVKAAPHFQPAYLTPA